MNTAVSGAKTYVSVVFVVLTNDVTYVTWLRYPAKFLLTAV